MNGNKYFCYKEYVKDLTIYVLLSLLLYRYSPFYAKPSRIF